MRFARGLKRAAATRAAACVAAFGALAIAPAAQGQAAPEPLVFLSVASGGLDGGYHRVAMALCAEFNAAHRGAMRCSPEVTPGSVYNLHALRSGEVEFALAQADWVIAAREGDRAFAKEGVFEGLRGVAKLYTEAFTVLAARDARIEGFADLAGERVNVGPFGSGSRATVAIAAEAFGFDVDHAAEVLSLPPGEMVDALCAGRIDAGALVVGHPSAIVARAISDCGARLVPVAGPEIDALVAGSPFYERALIPAFHYGGSAPATRSFGVAALLVTDERRPEPQVAALTRTLLTRIGALARQAPLLVGRDAAALRAIETKLPLHLGARSAFEAAEKAAAAAAQPPATQ